MRIHRAQSVPPMLFVALLLVTACGGDEGGGAKEADQQYAEAMAREHADDDASPSPAVEDVASTGVVTREVTFPSVEGDGSGFLALPEGVDAPPGVIVIQEWWGLNDNVRDMARQLAGEGYAALAVDLYRGEVATEPEAAREIMQRAMEHPDRLEADLAGAFGYLRDDVGSERIGVVGWCFGGGWALRAGLTIPELDAVVMYYGRVETSEEALAPLQAPLLGHFGAEDQGIPIASVREFEAALDGLGKVATIHVYEGAGHAFANPSGSRYQAEAADTAWARTLEFFDRYLKTSDDDTEERSKGAPGET